MTEPNITAYPPGSPSAIERGCTCGKVMNDNGQGYRGVSGVYAFDLDCVVHGEEARSRLDGNNKCWEK